VRLLRLRGEGLHWVETDGEVVALDDHTLEYLGANPAAAVLWKALAGGTNRDELVSCLLAEFEVEEEQARRDVDGFVAELGARGLLEET
jgi:Coenzyme PQQ synthesis protein D (PqqD)